MAKSHIQTSRVCRKPLPDFDRVNQLLGYNPETGLLWWKVRRGCSANVGHMAGTVSPDGYIRVTIDRQKFLAHRLIFLLMTGNCPDEIDHVNRIKSDNSWANLRPATHTQNVRNRSLPRNNKSGHKGVHWNRSAQRWQAQIKLDGKLHYIGQFEGVEEAASAYRVAAEKLHGQFAAHVSDAIASR